MLFVKAFRRATSPPVNLASSRNYPVRQRRFGLISTFPKHYFCRHCGIYTHHQRRSNPNQFGINVACLEGINPLTIPSIPTVDGINHPADT